MFAKVSSLGILGISGYLVTVEVDFSPGLPSFDIVGLPGTAVRESKNRVRAALKNSGFELRPSRVTVNLAPADMPKEGPVYDLPILVGLLLATKQLSALPEGCAFAGELSLEGGLRPSAGILPMAIEAQKQGIRTFFVPEENAPEGAAVRGLSVIPVKNVRQLCDMLTGIEKPVPADAPLFLSPDNTDGELDFSDVRGQENAKRALEIAAAGGHNVLMIGPPGSGKSMLAKRLPSILPPMTETEMLEVTQIHSIAGLLGSDRPIVLRRPFRSPHHTISPGGLAGGGAIPRPGELSLADHGILFLDELPEFQKNALEVLRQPMEDKSIRISRAAGVRSYPCDFTLICAMNPCPCGYYGSQQRACTCTPPMVARYLSKISGPLLDRIDLHVNVKAVPYEKLQGGAAGETSAVIRARVSAVRQMQTERYRGRTYSLNSALPHKNLDEVCRPTAAARAFLQSAFEKLSMTARSYDRVLRTARTIADLEGCKDVDLPHLAEAVQYRSLDRSYWSDHL